MTFDPWRPTLFSSKVKRLRFLRSIAFVDITCNTGDTLDIAEPRASELVTSGVAELAPNAPIMRNAQPIEKKRCWRCDYAEQSFYNHQCEHCRAPI